jgi:hypothetical protein
VCSVPTEVPAAERARWLAELAEALTDAHELLHCLSFVAHEEALASELYLRIGGARLEVQSLRLSRSLNGRRETCPEWTEADLWRHVRPLQTP